MNLRTEILIVGAGLAGAAAARSLRGRDVLVAERATPGSGASGAAAGLVNPLLGRRARPVWRMDEALGALHDVLEAAGYGREWKRGVLRPAQNGEQAARFADAAVRHPDIAEWLDGRSAARAFPHVAAPEGALLVREGGAVEIPLLCRMLLEDHDVRLSWSLLSVGEEDDRAEAVFETPEGTVRVSADVVILAVGAGYTSIDACRGLNLHRVKGQTVTAEIDLQLPDAHPHVAGVGYIAIDGPGSASQTRVVLGSTYEHDFDDERPTDAATAAILDKTTRLMPAVATARIIERRAGIRVTVPRTRLPQVGPLPGHRRTWVFSGLGAKGLLMAPLVARELPRWMRDPNTIPEPLRPTLGN